MNEMLMEDTVKEEMNDMQINTHDAQQESLRNDESRNLAPPVFIELKLVGDII